MVDGLVLINCTSQTAGWLEWVYHKVNIKSLKRQASSAGGQYKSGLPDGVVDYLLWYHLGRGDSLDSMSLASIYKQHFAREVNPRNLLPLLQAYLHRTDLGLAREINSANGKPLFGATRSLK